jgi:hypothetical protein
MILPASMDLMGMRALPQKYKTYCGPLENYEGKRKKKH